MESRRGKIGQAVIKLALVVAAIWAAYQLLLPAINSPRFQQFTEAIGYGGYFVIIGLTIVSHVLAPVAGSPAVALGVTIYGIEKGMWLIYLAGLVSATINFQIAKRYGRDWVQKLAGKEAMAKIDEFAAIEGKLVLVLARLLAFSLFDFISYAAGLTAIGFRDYFLITAIGNIFPTLLMQYLFRETDFTSQRGVIIWGASIMSLALVSGIAFRLYLRKKRQSQLLTP